MIVRLLLLLLALVAAPAAAETLATPATFNDVLQRARPGDVIRLAPGTYEPIKLRDRHWTPPVTVEAGQAELRGGRFDDISGLTWHGGVFEGGDTLGAALKFQVGDHIIVDGAAFHHFTSVGVILGRVTDARLTNNVVTDSGSDGFDVTLSQRVVVDHNRCQDFHPLPGAHPDCVQLWSKPEFAPVADIVITNNIAIGDMQGFTGFDGPLNRVRVEHNFAHVTNWHGVAMFDCHDCALRHNRVETMFNPRFPEVRAWVLVKGGERVIDCDNRAKDYPDYPGRRKCKKGEEG